jgi:hypothetical protein
VPRLSIRIVTVCESVPEAMLSPKIEIEYGAVTVAATGLPATQLGDATSVVHQLSAAHVCPEAPSEDAMACDREVASVVAS